MQSNIEQRICIKFCAEIKKTPAETFWWQRKKMGMNLCHKPEKLNPSRSSSWVHRVKPIPHIFHHCNGVARWGTTRAVVVLVGLGALAKLYANQKHGFVTRIHPHFPPWRYEEFSRKFSFFFRCFAAWSTPTGENAICELRALSSPSKWQEVGKWRCLGRFRHICPSNSRPRRLAGTQEAHCYGTVARFPELIIQTLYFSFWRKIFLVSPFTGKCSAYETDNLTSF